MYYQKIAVTLLVFINLAISERAYQDIDLNEFCLDGTIIEQVPYPNDCEKFILCIFGQGEVLSCYSAEYETIFYDGACREGDPRTCYPGPPTLPPTTTTLEPPTTTTLEPPVITTLEPTQTPSTEGPPDVQEDYCKGVNIGLRPHPSYCHKYIFCLLDRVFEYECDENDDLEVCLKGDEETCTFTWQANGGQMPFEPLFNRKHL